MSPANIARWTTPEAGGAFGQSFLCDFASIQNPERLASQVDAVAGKANENEWTDHSWEGGTSERKVGDGAGEGEVSLTTRFCPAQFFAYTSCTFRDREGRISALNAAKQAEKEELQKKIKQKQEETARRHEENMEQIRQKAIELSAPRVQEENAAPSSCRVCTLCNVLVRS